METNIATLKTVIPNADKVMLKTSKLVIQNHQLHICLEPQVIVLTSRTTTTVSSPKEEGELRMSIVEQMKFS